VTDRLPRVPAVKVFEQPTPSGSEHRQPARSGSNRVRGITPPTGSGAA